MKIYVLVDTSSREELIEASSELENMALRLDAKESDIDGKTDNTIDDNQQQQDGGVADDNQQQQEAPEGVDLAPATTIDAKIPWDARIHSSGKTKLAKAPHGWALKRNLEKNSPGLLAQVEAELAKVMAASPEKPIETATTTATTEDPKPTPKPTPSAPTPAPTPAAPVKYLVQGVAYTKEELIGFNSGWTEENIAELPIAEPEPAATTELTWPQLLAKITAGKNAGTIDDAAVTAACNAQGLESIQLVGARPDLWAAIDTALFG